ncbi:nucleotidyl transferase AbiEii/AbiGii toxin family protein [Devosia sp. A369]
MLQIDALREDTRQLYLDLRALGGFEEFVLIGGTAMALHHAHRESEDLDFVYVPASGTADRGQLPMGVINSIIRDLADRGHAVRSITNDEDMENAENEGFYLPNSHQDWSVNGVKLTFFAGDTADRLRPFHTLETVEDHGLRILTSKAIFETKSRLIVQRRTTRDLFDLWFYLDRMGEPIERAVGFAHQERPHYSEDQILRLFQPLKKQVDDPGFKPIVAGAPQDFQALIAALATKVDEYQQRVAEEVLREDAASGFSR